MTDPAAGVAANDLGADSAPANGARANGPSVNAPSVNGRVEGPARGVDRTPPEERIAPPPPRLRVPGQVPELKPDTPMQKVVLPGLVELTLGNVVVPDRFHPHRIAGFVTRLEDVPASSSSELARRYGLDQVAGWPVTDELYVLRFYAHSPQLYIAPFERSVYQVDLLELPAGTELWQIDAQGDEQRVGAYLNRQVGWGSTARPMLGPGGWNRPPVPLRPTLPGKRPPKEFTEQAGAYTLPVMICELDSLDMVRWRGGWNGLPVELVESE